jgi:hypothetical protein
VVTDRPSPLDALVDLLVYGPVGLAKTVTEEYPGLVAKGRATVDPQLATARLIGQFVVAEGRRRFTARLGFGPGAGPAPASDGGAPPVPGSPSAPDGGASDGAPTEAAAPPVTVAPEAAAPPVTVAPEAAAPKPSPAPRRVARPASVPAGGGTPSPDGLAIPGYDSLSASQVVQRLAGLSAPELAAVGAYEAATRGRRTILTRVAQLQAG